MPRLPQLSGQAAIRLFEGLGYRVIRQRGSHVRLLPPEGSAQKPLTIPDHHVLGKGLLRKLIRDAGISINEFLRLR